MSLVCNLSRITEDDMLFFNRAFDPEERRRRVAESLRQQELQESIERRKKRVRASMSDADLFDLHRENEKLRRANEARWRAK